MKKEHVSWVYAAVWLLSIYVTLPIVRPICNALKELLPFSIIMKVVLVGTLATLIVLFYHRISASINKMFVFVLALFGYMYGGIYLKHPEEIVHFFQYGVLAALFFKALKNHPPSAKPYFIAFLLTSLAGYGDELIQGWLPGRYYQMQDVVLNAVSAILGLMVSYATVTIGAHESQ